MKYTEEERGLDRAVEVAIYGAEAKRSPDGTIIPRHRWTRSLEKALALLSHSIYVIGFESVSLIQTRRADGESEFSCRIDGRDWYQEATVVGVLSHYSPMAVAICRAVIQIRDDTEDE